MSIDHGFEQVRAWARNDQMSGPVALATCAAVVGTEEDDLRVIDALSRKGIEAIHAVWDEPKVDWRSFHLVVVRSTWDYIQHRSTFLAWAEKLPRILNPAPILRWNTDKHYLSDLAKAGLPVIPTHFVESGDAFEPLLTPFVIKPAISCAAKDTARYEPGDKAALNHVRWLQSQGRTVMVQPYLSSIDAAGEVAVIFIGGAYSHSIRRAALLKAGANPDRAHSLPLNVQRHEATGQELHLAEQIIRHLPVDPAELLYARVDLVPGANGEPLVLEVELTEPALFLEFSEGGADRLADAIAAALEEGRRAGRQTTRE
jgi:glutathione synthase/RimK-type ligase-like ATP-grasp enzyme